MTETMVLTASATLQCIAAILALRLVWLTKRRSAWLLIAVAVALLAVRRSITLSHWLSGHMEHPPVLEAEVVAMVASGLLVVGLARIAPFFRFAGSASAAIRVKEHELMAANQLRDEQNQQLTASNQQLRATEQQLRASNQQLTAANQQLRATEQQLRLNNAANLARLNLIEYSYTHSVDELLEEAVNLAERLTQSKIGFIHFVDPDQEHLILQNWSTQTKEKFCKAGGKGDHYPIAKAGVWVDCVRERKPVIHNNYLSLPHRKGMPEGHAHVEREMVAPVITGGILKAILGVGNKETDYTEQDAEFLTLISTLAWETVERRTGSDELQRYKDHLEELVDRRTRALIHSQAELTKAKEAAELANRTKSSFLANMSHEIRTPMNAILGFAQIIERDPKLDPAHAVRIRSINRAGQHLLTLINDILDMAKIEAGVTGLNLDTASLQDMLEDLLLLLRSRAEAKGLQVIMERDPKLPFHVICDAAKLRQVLVNLIGNAIKFTTEGGVAVRVRSEPQGQAECGPSDDARKAIRLIVEVEDSGPGIPQEEIERIFNSFVQGRAGDSAGGTGLGLPISRRLTELMGGTLTVRSEVGKGSCFRVEVPLEETEAIPEAEDSEPPPLVVGLADATGPKRILVVDDIRDNRDLLRDLLQSVGFEIKEAHNGKEALEIFADWTPHAVLMDMRMPIMDGYEATRRIKATEQGRSTPVIAITASAFRESEAEILQTGVSAYLRKPFKADELYEVLRRNLRLEYVYAARLLKPPKRHTSDAADFTQVAALPSELRRVLKEAVEAGDMEQFEQLLKGAAPSAPDAASTLTTLAGRYDYGRLTQLLSQGEETNA